MMTSTVTNQTTATLTRHLQAFGSGSVDALLADYTEESVFFTPTGPVRGLTAIRDYFTALMAGLPAEMMDTFRMERQDVDGESAYVVWSAVPFFLLGTDTFWIHNDKIMVHTYAVYGPS
ncbi:MAG: nuclear transport factor 2 family protein [Thermomicrobiales bacterium]